MTRLKRCIAVAFFSLPLIAAAQTPTSKKQPADQPRTTLEKQQTEQIGESTKYGEPGSANSSQRTAADSPRKPKVKKTRKAKSAESTDTPTTK